MPLLPPSTSRTFSSSQTESLSPLNINSPSPLPLTPGNHRSTFLSLWVYLVLGTSYNWDHTYLSFCVWLISLSISLGILDSSLEFGNPNVLATDFWSMWCNSSSIFSEAFALPALEMLSRSFSPKKPPCTFLIQLWIVAVCDGDTGDGFTFWIMVHSYADPPWRHPASCTPGHGGAPENPSLCDGMPGLPYPE